MEPVHDDEGLLSSSPTSPPCYLHCTLDSTDGMSTELRTTAALSRKAEEEPAFAPGVYTLFHCPGVGSTYPLALLIALDVQHELVVLDFEEVSSRKSSDPNAEEHADSPDVRRLLRANPLAQFPTLVTPEGVVMTEMAGIALYLVGRHGKETQWSIDALSEEQRAVFYRLMIFIPANIYPTITVLDFPERFITIPPTSHVLEHISAEAITGWVRERAITNRMDMFSLLEEILNETVVGKPEAREYALGTEHPTILDVFITLIAHYSPRPKLTWLQAHCPRIFSIAAATLKHPVIRNVFVDAYVENSGFDTAWPGLVPATE